MILALASVYYCVALSWIDFSSTLIKNPYYFKDDPLEKIRFFFDLLILAFYSYLFAYVDYINSEPFNKYIIGFFITFTIIYLAYIVSGVLRRIKYGKKASKILLLIIFAGIFMVITVLYWYCYAKYGSSVNYNRLFIALTLVFTYLYRKIRPKISKRSYRIAVDVDGVLANQIFGLLPVIEKEYGEKLKYEDIVNWRQPIGNTGIDKIIVNEQKNRRYVLNMPMHEGAKEAIDKLSDKYYIDISTARSNSIDNWTKEWLERNGIKYDKYFHSKEEEKHNADVNFDILIDDYIGNIKRYLEKHDGKAILFSQPWNNNRSGLEEYIKSGRLSVVENWKEVVESVDKLLNN